MSNARQKFYEQNREVISKRIQAEKNRRIRRNIPELTPQELDEYLDEAMEAVKSGGRIRDVKFAESARPQEPETPEPNIPHIPNLPRQPRSKTKSEVKPAQNVFAFEAVVCSNGFVLSCVGPNGPDQFIFKNKQELLEIFELTVFQKLEELKAKKARDDHARAHPPEPKRDSGGDAQGSPNQHKEPGPREKTKKVDRRPKGGNKPKQSQIENVLSGDPNSSGKDQVDKGVGGQVHQQASEDRVPTKKEGGRK